MCYTIFRSINFLFAALCVCIGGIISLLWFSKELKNNLSKNNWLCGVILILLVRESIFVGQVSISNSVGAWYKLSLCHIPIKSDLLGFPGIGVFVCGLLNSVFKRFASFVIFTKVRFMNDFYGWSSALYHNTSTPPSISNNCFRFF